MFCPITRTIKVLPLNYPFTCEKEWWEDCLLDKDKISPIFSRNGFYYCRKNKVAWLEIDSEAWLYSAKTFLHELKIKSHTCLSERAQEAIEILMRERICPKTLIELYYLDKHVKELKETYLSAQLYSRKILKDFN